MRKTYVVGVCLFVVTMLLSSSVQAENSHQNSLHAMTEAPAISLDQSATLLLRNGRNGVAMSPVYSRDLEILLFEAVKARLGTRYRSGGTDDRGFDCSGFVWRVFQDSGIDFQRMPARSLWEMLPEADERDQSRFGTLVFFNDLDHIGIVRDGNSFYHASTSQGVVRSYFDGYWAARIVGFRRIHIPAKGQRTPRKSDSLAERPTMNLPTASLSTNRVAAYVETERSSRLNKNDRQQVRAAADVRQERSAKKRHGLLGWILP